MPTGLKACNHLGPPASPASNPSNKSRSLRSTVSTPALSEEQVRPRVGCFELVRTGRALREEGEDAAAEFFGEETIGGGVKRAGDHPKLFRAASGGVNHFRMAAGQGDILFAANQQNRKRARGDRLLRRNFRDGKAREFFVAIKQRPGEGSE